VLSKTRSAAGRAAAEAAFPLALAGATALLYGPVLRLWWTHDDFNHFRYLLTHRPYWYFFDGAALKAFSTKVFTPLLFFSLDLDRRLFGADPHGFYLHQLAAVAACSAALYGVLSCWLPRAWAAVASWLFLVGPVTASLASMLMVRHYLEAILAALLAVGCWAAALRSAGKAAWGWSILSSALYLAACLAKEVAVPLAVLLPFLPPPTGGRPLDLPRRLHLALPHAAALVLYLGLRYAVLGSLFGRSGFTVEPSGLPALALALPAKIAAELIGGRLSLAGVVLGLALAAGMFSLLLARSRRAAALAALALLLALLPVLTVSSQMQPRLAAATWVVAVVAFATGGRTLAGRGPGARRIAVGLAALACASGLWLNRRDWRDRFAEVERMSAENRFFLDLREGDVLRHPLTLAASLRELQWMKANVYHRPPGGLWFQDDLYLCLHPELAGRVWGWRPAVRRVVDLTPRIPVLRRRHCSSIRGGAPLRAGFRFQGDDLFWDLGPYRQGTYRFVMADGVEAYDMPRRAGFKVGPTRALPLRIAYRSPAGWITYSPELVARRESVLRWSRPPKRRSGG
jgi:hypothetical protein